MVMAARNLDKAKEAEQVILEETPDAVLDVRPLDLASLESVKEFDPLYSDEIEQAGRAAAEFAIVFMRKHY